MATTKPTKSRGKSDKERKSIEAELLFLDKAAKMIPYRVDIYERIIYVPEPLLAEAMDNDLAIAMLCKSYNFHVQSCVPSSDYAELKEVYNPELSNIVRVKEEAILSPYKDGQLYKSTSTGTVMTIVRTDVRAKKVELGYVTYEERLGARPNLLISFEQMESNIRRNILVEYHQ